MKRAYRRRVQRLALFVIACGTLVLSANAADRDPSRKKLIEWDANEPNTAVLRDHIEQMERLPFDGIVFHTSGPNFTWEIWGGRKFVFAELEPSLRELQKTRFRRFTDRFLRVNATPGNVDWFDDAAWGVLAANFELAARVAKEGACKGLMFDTEQYQGAAFCYPDQKRHGKFSFAQYEEKVRQRGGEWMRAVNRQFPDITVLVTFGYAIAQPPKGETDRSREDYGLLTAFLDGALAACAPSTRIVDAWELSYGYKRREQFKKAYDSSRKGRQEWTTQPERYGRHLEVGFGLWLDNNSGGHAWNVRDPSRNYFTPAAFEESLRSALEISDQYVWIYSGQPNWWTGERLPRAYLDALTAARKPAPKKVSR